MNDARDVVVPLERLARWLDGFTARNGSISERAQTAEGYVLRTERGGSALLRGLAGVSGDDATDIVAAAAGDDREIAVLLVRRGGYSIAHVRTIGPAHDVVASKTDQKYVQGRTAAGGQSQQRFARRRAGQAAALVRTAADTAVRVLSGSYAELVTGGDLPLIDELLSDRRLSRLAGLHKTHVEISGDPRRKHIDEAVVAARSARIIVRNASPGPAGPGESSRGPA